jgi:hypothetical protein
MGRATTLSILTVALLLFLAAPAVAKDGFYLGVNVLFNDITGEINAPENIKSGNGLGLHGGFGFNQYIGIEAGVWKTKHPNILGGKAAYLEAGTFDLKVNLPIAGSHIEPYLLVGVGSYTIKQQGISDDGKGGRFGLGMDIYLFPDISFNVGITRNSVTFTHNSINMDGKITTMDFGIIYHFI